MPTSVYFGLYLFLLHFQSSGMLALCPFTSMLRYVRLFADTFYFITGFGCRWQISSTIVCSPGFQIKVATTADKAGQLKGKIIRWSGECVHA